MSFSLVSICLGIVFLRFIVFLSSNSSSVINSSSKASFSALKVVIFSWYPLIAIFTTFSEKILKETNENRHWKKF
jgi:hypothetical protein